jgi:ribosomal protein L29
MTYQDLTTKTQDELRALLQSQRDEYRALRARAAEGQLKEIHKINATRKLIARIQTALHSLTKAEA